ncbi:hypothetical protein A1O1_05780 [Capronia coronata CBS 617.96]|uniref:Uncharacterized protein n=1 Tax=Capronia coronata CBS 617.96 TaxID=1182541 RepID=W9Y871_9EURO|nr:uncharacterized protein A1O1_05780 [Capronia coronata CBS 617.96]EXJ85416.1 hypothetical protein A1O1_05780 [Capronia coronata CBS 617.96]
MPTSSIRFRPKATASQKTSKHSIFSWFPQKRSSTFQQAEQPVHIEPSVLQPYSSNIESQVDKAWSSIFVSCRCEPCWPPKQPAPRLCTHGTYNKFWPSLWKFADVYGSDGPKIFWEMILQDIQQYMIVVNDPGARYSESRKETLSQLLGRAERQLHGTTATWGWLGQPRASCSTNQTSTHVIVPAPPGRGIEGERAIWMRAYHSADEEHSSKLERIQNTRIVNINGRKLQLRKHHFDESYLGRKDGHGSARFARRSTTGSKTASSARKPSPLSQFITAQMVQYPTFTQQPARWTLATLGNITAFASLSAFVVTVTKKYGWEGMTRNHALSILKQLQPRKDLLVRLNMEEPRYSKTDSTEKRRRRARSTVERRVQCIEAVLGKMADEYDIARGAFACGISIGVGQQDVKVVQELVSRLMDGRS